MQYALMIYADPGYHEALSDAEREAAHAEYLALADDARCVGDAQLQPAETATCVRVVGGRTLMTDGPFADTKEVLGGLCLVEAANLDEAIELAARIPAARLGYLYFHSTRGELLRRLGRDDEARTPRPRTSRRCHSRRRRLVLWGYR